MAKITDFYRVVSPTQAAATIHDNQQIDQGYAFSSNYTWYQRLIQGSATRLARYREYDIMDNDVEIARALDIIAEEMTSRNTKTDMVLNINMQIDDGQDIEDTVVLTLRSALRHWSILHGFNENRLFKIARNMIKYGDCFFKIHSSYKKWEWIPASNVIGAVVDAEDVTKVLAYQVRMDAKVPNSNSAAYNGTGATAVGNQAYSTEVIPVEHMAVFSINDDMSETAPFGDSALRTVYKTHKQKELLEDAIVIYRIQRAPERRVFYIDVGKMQPNRVKTYLETIKNEIRQKKIPSNNQNGKDSVDAVYNPASMLEDIFLAQRCISLNTKIPLLDGRTLFLHNIIQEYNDGKKNYVYSINQKTGEFIPGEVEWAGITRKNAELVRVWLDSGDYIDCTPDHKFVMRDGSEVTAIDLKESDSLMPIYKKYAPIGKSGTKYEIIFCNKTKKWLFTHLLVNPEQNKENVIHHIDYTSLNNNPTNLLELSHEDHWKRHHSVGGHTLGRLWRENRDGMIEAMKRYQNNRTDKQKQRRIVINTNNGYISQARHGEKNLMILENNRKQFRDSFATRGDYISHFKRMSQAAQDSRTPEQLEAIRENLRIFNKKTKSYNFTTEMYDIFVDLWNMRHQSASKMGRALTNSVEFQKLFTLNNTELKKKRDITLSSQASLNKLVNVGGWDSYMTFKNNYSYNNHKVSYVEVLSYTEDTGCLTIKDSGDNHNFAVASGVYIKNSDGKGSKVEVLPGGQSLGEMADLDYFMDKVLRGLRVPISWMKTGVNSAMFNDGKVGAAYIEEQQFAKFVERLQVYIEVEMDKAFKNFLFASNINIDNTLFQVKLPSPSNYEHYQQAEVDTTLLNTLSQAEAVPYLSKRFILSRYAQLSEDEIITNEQLLKQEKGFDPDADKSLQQIYGASAEGAGGLGGSMGGGLGGGLGGGMGGMGLGEEGGEEGGLGAEVGAAGAPEAAGAAGTPPPGAGTPPPAT